MASSSWRPILDGARRDRAHVVLERARELLLGDLDFARDTADPRVARATLADGLPGVALAQAYLGVTLEDDRLIEASVSSLEHALAATADLGGALGLVRGAAGVGIVLEQLTVLEVVDGAELASAIDDVLTAALTNAQPMHFDLAFGLAGWLVYAIERGAMDLARSIVARLSVMVDETGDGACWRTPPDPRWTDVATIARYPRGHTDLGVAHGVIGVAGALAAAHVHGAFATGELIDSALAFCAAQRGPHGELSALLEDDRPSPTGWCYGDPGAAAVELVARRAMGDDSERHALAAARRAARQPVDTSRGIGLCHGTAGQAHAYNRLYQVTGDHELCDGALRTLDATMDALEVTSGRHGVGLFNGLAGAALVLAAAVAPREPAWDRMFLLSVRSPV